MEPTRAGLEKLLLDSLRNVPREELPSLLWPLVCGTAVAERTQASIGERDTLIVRVPDVNWRNQLQSLHTRYLDALNRMLAQAEGPKVRDIRFTVQAAGPEKR